MPSEEYQDGYQPEEISTADINIGKVIQGNMLLLIADMAAVDSGIKFNNLVLSDFQKFYGHFLEAYLVSFEQLDEKTTKPIGIFFDTARNLHLLKNQEDYVKKALDLSVTMKIDLVSKGLWQVFTQAPEPPFMMDEII